MTIRTANPWVGLCGCGLIHTATSEVTYDADTGYAMWHKDEHWNHPSNPFWQCYRHAGPCKMLGEVEHAAFIVGGIEAVLELLRSQGITADWG